MVKYFGASFELKKSCFPGWDRVNEGSVPGIAHTVKYVIFRVLQHYTKRVEEVLTSP